MFFPISLNRDDSALFIYLSQSLHIDDVDAIRPDYFLLHR